MALGKWLAGLIGNASIELPDGVPESWANAVQQALAPVDGPKNGPKRAGLAGDILAFVLTGEPAAILHEIAQNTVVGQQLQLVGWHFGRSDLGDIYQDFEAVPAAIALRWARVLEAAASSAKSAYRMVLPRAVNWPEILLASSCGYTMEGYDNNRKIRRISAQKFESLLAEDGLQPFALLVAASPAQ